MSTNEIWKKYKTTGDEKLKEILVNKYITLVKKITGKMMSRIPANIEYEDLIEEGIIGLIEAIDRYDLTRKVKFETYAQVRIRGAILDVLRREDLFTRSNRQKLKNLEQTYQNLEEELGRIPTEEEVAENLNIGLSEYHKLLLEVAPLTLLSLDEQIERKEGDVPWNLMEAIEDTDALDPVKQLEKKEKKVVLISAIKNLPENERKVLALYYYEDLTLKEIAEVMGISESRVSQLHTQGIIKLRSKLRVGGG